MSMEAVQQVIGRAVTDPEFCQLLIEDARAACQGYDVTEDEINALEALDHKSMRAFAGSLDPRITKTGGKGFI